MEQSVPIKFWKDTLAKKSAITMRKGLKAQADKIRNLMAQTSIVTGLPVLQKKMRKLKPKKSIE